MRKILTHIGFLLVLISISVYQLNSTSADINSNSETQREYNADSPQDLSAGPVLGAPIIEIFTPPPVTAAQMGVLSEQEIQKSTTRQPIVKDVPVSKPTPTPQPIATCGSGSFQTQFLCILNEYRKSQGLNALKYDTTLNSAANYHSTWMNQNSTMSHIGEDGSKFYERCALFQTTCDAENVARGYTTARKLFEAWKASPSHNKNLLGSHTIMGLGLVGVYSNLVLR